MGVKIQTTIATSPDIILLHAPPHVEENMPENHSRRQLDIFGRRMKPHASSEKHVSVETDDASCDARHSCQRGKKTKKWLITGTPLNPALDFVFLGG